MSLATVFSRASNGIDAPLVTVEAHISNGLPGFSIVGLPETVVKESKDRVRSAILNAEFEFPGRRITINLGPADLPKEGGRFDLPIALGILAASAQIPQNNLSQFEFAGELALTGKLRPIKGVLPFAMAADPQRILIVPEENAEEAALPGNVTVLSANHLLDVCAHLTGKTLLKEKTASLTLTVADTQLDIADVRGQHHAKRALKIAAAGQHSLLMNGQPGTGKTMLASRLPSLLPPLTKEQALAVGTLYSLRSKKMEYGQWGRRPFRAPHHTASSVALVGGGSPPKPGEISLSHHGVLFLDELPEFNRHVLEALREPLESGQIIISRAAHQTQFPAQFQLIAAMNPCPCGYLGDPTGRCHCSKDQVHRYQNKISGPLLDRIDLYVDVPTLPKGVLSTHEISPETSQQARAEVIQAQQRQFQRSKFLNATYTIKEINAFCQLSSACQKFLDDAAEKLLLSPRSYHRLLKVARTIADLAQQTDIAIEHIAEGLSFRRKVKVT